MTDGHSLEDVAQKVRLTIWHQIVTVLGIPLILGMGGYIWADWSSRISEIQVQQTEILAAVNRGDKGIALNAQRNDEQDRRIASLEGWRDKVTK